MIDRLKKQQDKLLTTERYQAWESIARKLAHEIKNPLTPIQLSIDRLKEKYSKVLTSNNEEFDNYLETINRQIKDIEKLVNEFSSFARMPDPLMKKTNIFSTIERAVNFFKLSSKNLIQLKCKDNNIFINGDEEQLYRVFINLIKNSEESFLEKKEKKADFKGKIDIEIIHNNDYIEVKLIDNGTGILNTKEVMAPYYTTKIKGTGLGLPIVSKIISEHGGELLISNNKTNNSEGVEILISLPKYNEK
jgi:two-component system nitrogen regulation sensor histidine kinase NtrY